MSSVEGRDVRDSGEHSEKFLILLGCSLAATRSACELVEQLNQDIARVHKALQNEAESEEASTSEDQTHQRLSEMPPILQGSCWKGGSETLLRKGGESAEGQDINRFEQARSGVHGPFSGINRH